MNIGSVTDFYYINFFSVHRFKIL